jgi:hypothetical protein
MMRIDDVVADLEVTDGRLNFEVDDLLFGYLCGGTDCCLLLWFLWLVRPPSVAVGPPLDQIAVDDVDLL